MAEYDWKRLRIEGRKIIITGIRDFYYNIQDMDRAVKFYTQVLPFKYVTGDEYWTTLVFQDPDGNILKIMK